MITIYGQAEGIIFVDNERVFNDEIAREGHQGYFIDMLACYFGHCTHKGSRLLAENAAHIIFKKFFINKIF